MTTIFVFGSNLAGRHGRGAAKDAAEKWGAQYGVGEGRTGRSYALPTKNARLQPRSLGQIQDSVETFLAYARVHPELTFQVTRVGCGLTGYSDDQIGPMFKGSPDNCVLPEPWEVFR